MFRKELFEKLQLIFGFHKSTYSAPSVDANSGSFEQDTLFLDIEEARSRFTQGRVFARVQGSLTIFSQYEKFPFGYFNKRIEKASPQLVKNFFFYDVDVNPASSPARIQNIGERRTRFIYLYEAQFDPNQGDLTSVVFGG